MGNKVYAVYHCWSKFYYNAIEWEKELICCFDSLAKAKEFKKRYSLPYDDSPWALQKGQIKIEELPTTYDEKDLWWLPKKEEKKTTEPIKHIKSDDFKKEPKKHIPLFFEYTQEDLAQVWKE